MWRHPLKSRLATLTLISLRRYTTVIAKCSGADQAPGHAKNSHIAVWQDIAHHRYVMACTTHEDEQVPHRVVESHS